jgi:hypothetical protein
MSKIDKLFSKTRVNIPIYEIDCYFFTKKKDYIKAMNHVQLECDLEGVDGRVHSLIRDGIVMYYIGVFNGRMDTLVHEVTHASLFIADNLGIDAYASSSEPVCYLNGFLFGECVQRGTFKI